MIILRDHKVIFIRTQKTASTSIIAGLLPYVKEGDVVTWDRFEGISNKNNKFNLVPHCSATVIKRFYPEEFSNFTSFTVERNPFDRVVSDFHWKKEAKLRDGSKPSFGIPEDMKFSQFVKEKRFLVNEHMYTDGFKLSINTLLAYEHISETLPELMEKHGINFTFPSEKKKETTRTYKDYRDYYNKESIKIVSEANKFSMDILGYSFNKKNPKKMLVSGK